MSTNNSKLKKIIVYFILFYLFFLLLFTALYISLIYDVKYIPFDFELVKEGNKVGFNVATDALHFGTLGPNGFSKRHIVVKVEKPSLVLFKVPRFWQSMIFINASNPLLIYSKESKTVDVLFIPSPNLEEGNYSGNLTLIFLECPSFLCHE